MSLQRFIEDFEEAVEDIEPNSLTAATNFKALEAWDSLAVLTVIAMVDAEYDLRLKADILKDCDTLEALYARVTG
jgi:acyl carrier protein